MRLSKVRAAGRVRKDALPDHPSSSAASVWGDKNKCSYRLSSARRVSARFGLRRAGSRAGWMITDAHSRRSQRETGCERAPPTALN